MKTVETNTRGFDLERLDRITGWMQNYVDTRRFAGSSLLVARGAPGSVGDFSWGGIASTFFWVDPVLDLSVVFFTQLTPSSAYAARPQLKALIHGALMR